MKTIDVCFALDPYKPFFDYPDFDDLAKQAKGTRLEEALEDLRYAWHTASAVHCTPFTLAGLVTRGFNAFVRLRRNDFHCFNEYIKDTKLAPADLSKLAEEESLEDGWKGIIEDERLQLPFMFMQRIAYSHLYFAYENFLLVCARVAAGSPKLRTTDRKPSFAAVLSKHFDAQLADFCWTCDNIQLVKGARNAIVHNGCKSDKPIGPLNARFGELQVSPSDVSRLFNDLKERVILLVNHETTQRVESRGGAVG